ncbi:DUF6053 domain-containing protein [Lysobacter yananisis]|uniref:DUF6053 domain-containing protein n=1 Tax=Lysobacter yananisis TaxID=1003114 RepID=UPI003CE4D4C2
MPASRTRTRSRPTSLKPSGRRCSARARKADAPLSWEGASVPTLSCPIAATGKESVGTEVPPTQAKPSQAKHQTLVGHESARATSPERRAVVGGPSGPTLLCPIAATGKESAGTEVPPTQAKPSIKP